MASIYYTTLLSVVILYMVIGNVSLKSVSSHVKNANIHCRIIGGCEAKPHIAKFMVFVEATNSSNYTSECGGSLISPNYVLTAKHCLRGFPKTRVYIGAHDLWEDRSITQIRDSSLNNGYILHDEVDLALLKLDRPVNRSEYIGYIRLPTKDYVNNTYEIGQGDVYGWGVTEENGEDVSLTLNYVEVNLDKCPSTLRDEYICTNTTGKGICDGDSGGPLVVFGIQVGVVSLYRDGCNSGVNYFVSLLKHVDWLEENTDIRHYRMV